MGKNTIEMGILTQEYPGFVFMGKGAELCGYNPQNKEYLVIDDGMCRDDTGTWVVHHYRITSPDFNPFDVYKHPGDGGVKISEERVSLAESDNKEALGHIKAIEMQLINRLCWIPDPEIILPHMVFIEDVNEKGEPEYYHCTLEAINPNERTCTLFNRPTGERDSDWQLSAINIDWLDTLWKRYREQKTDVDPELLYLAENDNCEEQKQRPGEIFAFVFPASRLKRNATDAEILADYENNQEEEELTVKFTPDEFAAYCNDGFFNDLEQSVRCIQQ